MEGAVPKINELNSEKEKLMVRKKEAYSEYRKVKKDMKEYQIARSNVDSFMRIEDKRIDRK